MSLAEQRNVIDAASNDVDEIDHDLYLTQRLAKTIKNRELMNKAILVLIVILLFVADVLTLYIKIFKWWLLNW